MSIKHFFIVSTWMAYSGAQFAYPADPNPPQVNTTFSCYVCEGAGCNTARIRGTHPETTCTGLRVACWTIKNTVTSVYTRTCEQPSTIRQGVFCNRHMEGKEFCFGTTTSQNNEKFCGKCCLNNRCNNGLLEGSPDNTLQTCVACQGEQDAFCNRETPLSAENSTYVEQCLLPNSDCWTQKRFNSEGKGIYVRGCQLSTCNAENQNEICSRSNGEETCEKCCKGKMCNRFANSAKTLKTTFVFIVVVGISQLFTSVFVLLY